MKKLILLYFLCNVGFAQSEQKTEVKSKEKKEFLGVVSFGGAYNSFPPTGEPAHGFEVINNNIGQLAAFNNFYGAKGTGNGGFHFNTFDGTVALPLNIKAGRAMMSIGMRGYNGTSLSSSSSAIIVRASEDFSPTSQGSEMEFQVSENGTPMWGTRTTVLKLTAATTILSNELKLTSGTIFPIKIYGAGIGTKTTALVGLFDSVGTRQGYFGLPSSSNGDFYFHNDASGKELKLKESGEIDYDGDIHATGFKLSSLQIAPSSASDKGTIGEIRIVSDYIYVCTATDTWVRTALTTW